jgi:ABC-type Zn uptake system ZnuABC Zn-binding protein ZnuA
MPSKKSFLSLALLVVLVSCAPREDATRAPGQLNVVATTTILGDLARNVAGDRAVVVTLLPANADPHTFEPTPRDSQKLASADLLLYNGAGLEQWLEPLIASSGTRASKVTVSRGIRTRQMPADYAPNKMVDDPHMWFDVQNAIVYTTNIRDALVAADPANAEAYRANAEKYRAQLLELDAWVQSQVAQIPPERRKLVTDHDTLNYFATRYGFTVVGTVIASVSAEAQPSAQSIAQLIETIKRENVHAVFTENTVNPALAQQIARDAGAKIVASLVTDALTDTNGPADTYVKMMRYDVQTIVEALK